jgi:SAM-dependent methyltransferase
LQFQPDSFTNNGAMTRWIDRLTGGPRIKDEMYVHLDDKLGSRRAAEVVLPLIRARVPMRSLLDVGCGVGSWLAAAKTLGVDDVLGVDIDYLDTALLKIPASQYRAFDLRQPLVLERSFDVALALEVAGYLPPECAETLVGSLTRAAPVVVFSSAIPFQDSSGIQTNQQWPEYWARLFAARNYQVVDCLRRPLWSDPTISWWFSQNMLMFVREDVLAASPQLVKDREHTYPEQLSLVHPEFYLSKRPLRALVADVVPAAKLAVQRRLGKAE